jgi:ABC-type Mn2+/Zn2+ transport system permease subunit
MNTWLQFAFPTDPHLLWTLAIAVLTNLACAVVGTYLVLRRMSLLGDALAHAVLPGLVVAFLFSGSVAIGAMFVGAFAAAVATTFFTQTLHRQGGVSEDSSLGVVFTSLFALGVVLIKRYGSQVHIDPMCVLEGNLAYAAEQTIKFGSWEVPRAFASIAPVLLVNLLVVALLWKEFKLSSFDPQLASTLGFSSRGIEYLLMGLVAATTVGAFEAVGSIMVIAVLVAPAAAAHMWCDQLGRMMFTAALIAAMSAYLGIVVALATNTDPGGMIAVAAGGLYLLSFLFAPRHGVLAGLVRNLLNQRRIVAEDLLALLFRWEELARNRPLGASEAVTAVGGGWLPRWALWRLGRRRLVAPSADLQLTDSGRIAARQLVRSHRLWETYLVEQLGLPLDHVHEPAERMEHYISPQLQAELLTDLANHPADPHGRDIP